MKKYSIVIILCVIFLFAWYWIWKINFKKIKIIWEEKISHSERQSWYTFINPLLECEIQSEVDQEKYIPFEKKLIKDIQDNIMKKNWDINISIYFRNLQNGPWFGINEKEDFSPASLLKLPLLMAYLKWAEEDKTILEQKIELDSTPEWNLDQNYVPKDPVKIWKAYSIKELLYHLIIYSDNTASIMLSSFIPEELFFKVYTELGVPLPKSNDNPNEEFISVKDYASFFRILYNASYLNREYSETALKLLSESIYKNWIGKNIPWDIVIAHKFWERKSIWNKWESIYQLHDCGIIYYPKYPYLICIMTKWTTSDFGKLEKIIQDISSRIFQEVTNTYPLK